MVSPKKFLRSKLPLPSPAPSQRKTEKAKPDRPGIEVCRDCGAVFWRKAWRESLDAISSVPWNSKIIYVICPACKQLRNHLFEGEMIVENIPARFFDEILRRIKRLGERSRSRNPMSRILTLETSRRDARIRVTVSENQLARLMARKIREAFGGILKIALSKEESTLRVRLNLASH